MKQVLKLANMLTRLPLAILAGFAFLCCGFPLTAQAISFNQISQLVFFGDSLTDGGFYDIWPGLPPGKAPTFTTYGGFTWAQYVAHDIKGYVLPPPNLITNNFIYNSSNPIPVFVSGTLQGINFAAGGSSTNSFGFPPALPTFYAPSLHQQVNYYLSTQGDRLDPNAVYFIWSGANDILTVLASAPPIPTQLQLLQTANQAAFNIGSEVSRLSARGAKRIVVLSLPNIGYTPLIAGIAATLHLPHLPADMKTLTFTFNSMLNTQLGKVVAKYGTKILYVDVYTLLDNVILATQQGQSWQVAGQSFKFVNFTTPACSAPSSIACSSADSAAHFNYLFADTVHPTDMAHRVLSLEVEQRVQNWS